MSTFAFLGHGLSNCFAGNFDNVLRYSVTERQVAYNPGTRILWINLSTDLWIVHISFPQSGVCWVNES